MTTEKGDSLFDQPNYGYPTGNKIAPSPLSNYDHPNLSNADYNNYSSFQTNQTYYQQGVVATNVTPMTVYQQPSEDYMLRAVLVTLFCFWPTGILAIIKANESKKAYLQGDVSLGQTSAASARSLIKISVIVGIICISFGVIAIIVRVVLGIIYKF